MSLNRVMYTGVSGLEAESDAIGVVGDNVANANTVGFKRSRANFEDVLGDAVGSRTSAGGGVRVGRVQQIFGQGSVSSTGVSTDLALSGDGFFVVRGSAGGATGNFYTRDGQNVIREDGTLVNSAGLAVQGYTANPDGTFNASMSDVRVPTSALPPHATTAMNVTANLDSSATAPTLPWDPQNPGTTSNFSTATTVYDSLGNAHSLNTYFVKTGANTWDYHTLASGAEITGGTAGTNVEIEAGALTYTTGGALQSNVSAGPGTVSFAGAAANQAISTNLGTDIARGGTGLDGITQFAATSNVSAQSQDGYASGNLTGVSVDPSGVVSGQYTNGQHVAISRLAIASFRSQDGLARTGGNLWSATRDSGDAVMGQAGSGGRGVVVGGAIESSNVDITVQFVDLIAHQRAFQANSKTITTADQMLQEVINLKQ